MVTSQDRVFENRALASTPCTCWVHQKITFFRNRALAPTRCTISCNIILHLKICFQNSCSRLSTMHISAHRKNCTFQISGSGLDAVHIFVELHYISLGTFFENRALASTRSAHFGSILGPLGAVLCYLGLSWGSLGHSWAHLGLSWVYLGP